MQSFEALLNQEQFSNADLVRILSCNQAESELLFAQAHNIRMKYSGNKVYLRGLIEIGNVCSKDCFYCGIRKSNSENHRYTLSDEEVLSAAEFAWKNQYGSIVIQGGELESASWTNRIAHLLQKIKQLSNGELGITLSLGEQSEETFRRWFDVGAHRYLLRIESSDAELYSKIHPNNALHSYQNRLDSLALLKKCGYQVGTGVMIGLPWQNNEILANDLLTMKNLDIDMCGMGPYIEHHATPLNDFRHLLMPIHDRFILSLKMVAALRLLMKDVNIAATTAMETIDPNGRIKAFRAGANIVMPNITPEKYQDDYLLYDNKVGTKSQIEIAKHVILKDIFQAGFQPGLNEWGDSQHFEKRLS